VSDSNILWTACSAVLRSHISEAAWHTWFEAAQPASIEGDTLLLAVPSTLAKERIEQRYQEALHQALEEVTDDVTNIRLHVHAAAPSPLELDTVPTLPGRAPEHLSLPTTPPPILASFTNTTTNLDRRYTFEGFVTGTSNRFAHAAALSVAETPARSYNPLFIHGGAGLGKTHLLHAIGNYIKENYPSLHVRYVSTETFLNEFVDAIRTNSQNSFKKRYRECDTLLVDDVQFMENKEGLQEEFFHTFNSLYGASKQIVITSDRSPRAISTLENRLRSRFLSGLITDVQPPDLETRLAILKKKAESEVTSVPDSVLEIIAINVKDNIRELEGALVRVCAFASLNHEELNDEIAGSILADIVIDNETPKITPQRILSATAEMFGFAVDDLCGTSRARPLVTARQIGMYVFRELTDFSYPAIAREFGGRDHTTVIHAVEKITKLMREKRHIYNQVAELTRVIRTGR
jgi:chromosomal replication initiator protein